MSGEGVLATVSFKVLPAGDPKGPDGPAARRWTA